VDTIRNREVLITVFAFCVLSLNQQVLAGSISGRVTDVNDSPLENVWIELWQGTDPNIADEDAWDWVSGTNTDPNGDYQFSSLAERKYRIRVDKQEISGTFYAEANRYNVQVLSGQNTPDMDFELVEGGSISGRVIDVNDNPLENVGISLYQGEDPLIADQHAWNWVDWNSTDANGEYEFHGLEERRYHIHIYSQDVNGTQYIETDLYNVQVFSEVETPNMDFRLRQAGLIYGYVKTVGGKPIPYATVVAEAAWTQYGWGWHSTGTDSEGRYELWLAPSPGEFYPITVVDARLNGAYYESKWDGNFYKATYAGTRVDYILEPGGAISGRVLNEDGVGVEGVWVAKQWCKYGEFWQNTTTVTDGYFELGSLPTGINYIYLDNWPAVIQDGNKYSVGEAHAGPINISAGDVCDVGTFTIYEAGMITGVVTDESGFPVVAAEVEAEGQDINGDWAESDEGITDAFGQFTLDYVAPGTYVLTVEKPGFITTNMTDIKINRGEHVDIDLVMKSAAEGATISGSITNYSEVASQDSNGVPLPYYEDSDYDDFGLAEFEILAVSMDKIFTEEDYLDLDSIIIAWAEEDEIEDGYGDYFEANDVNETPGNYEMTLPSGDVAVVMSAWISYLPGWGGSVILHDWKRLNLTKGDTVNDVNFTAVTTETGTLAGNINVPADYNNFPEEWCMIYAYALDANDNIKTAIPLGDAIASPGWTTTYEFRNLPAGKYQLKAYARNLASVLDLPPVTVTASQTTIQDIVFTSGSTLTGHITDANSGTDVNEAVVTIQETGRRATTDDSGNYTITGINAEIYTVKVSALGYADAEVADVNIESNSTVILDFALDSIVGTISGTVKINAPNDPNINGATVLAYNETDETFKTSETVGGAFSITNLTPGEYILAVDAEAYGYGVVVYPPDGNRITLLENQDINDIDIRVETLQPPVFTVFSTVSTNGTGTLSMTFYSEPNLLAEPNITIVDGNGTLGTLISNGALNRFEITYDVNESDDIVLIQIAEAGANSLVPGNPASKVFTFEVGSNLVQTSSTNVTNATGGQAAIMGTQDNTQIYVPPFAIAGANDTQALTLTIARYGDPGDAVTGTSDTTVSAVYDFKFDNNDVTIDENHSFTVTMSFQLPEGMSHEEFENTLEICYFDAGAHEWKTDGISNVRINWANNTIMFEVSHLTKFAAFTEPENQPPVIVQEALDIVNGFAPEVFKKPKDQKKITKELNSVIDKLEKGKPKDLKKALKKLEKLIKKMDGCALKGHPDKKDSIIDCDAQAVIYPLLLDVIELLKQ